MSQSSKVTSLPAGIEGSFRLQGCQRRIKDQHATLEMRKATTEIAGQTTESRLSRSFDCSRGLEGGLVAVVGSLGLARLREAFRPFPNYLLPTTLVCPHARFVKTKLQLNTRETGWMAPGDPLNSLKTPPTGRGHTVCTFHLSCDTARWERSS